MSKVFSDVLEGREENRLLPFYWQKGNHTDRIPEQMKRIRESGCRAVCVESRPHPDFCGEGWWRDMDRILAEAKRLGMKVWILDDDHFPTGHANGLIAEKYPERRQWLLAERHIDVVGPLPDATVLLPEENDENLLLSVYAYPRLRDDREICLDEGTDLSERVHDGLLEWDIPAGTWRIFFTLRTRAGGRRDYIDMLNPASVDALIEGVYEPHFAHYGAEFGNTVAGFFSDEPAFGNYYAGPKRHDDGAYFQSVGCPGLALPWSDEVHGMMQKDLGFDPLAHANLLWYDSEGDASLSAKLRYAYMDAVTRLYRKHFSCRVGEWCRAHGVEYIGHVIEDEGTHARLFYGAGHYFRAEEGQDMAGMDVVLHQVMPGMQDMTHTATVGLGVARGPFFHYLLPKLAASAAHLYPQFRGRALCEIFGAYGWGEDLPMMKWLMDFLLVRGINHFVPHAFSPEFPDADCPPHFGAEGHDPGMEAFGVLMRYTNRAAHLLAGATHVANAAILYHAEAEWASPVGALMPDEVPARVLYDRHIDFDILPADLLSKAHTEEGRLLVGDEHFDCLILPAADFWPEELYSHLLRISAAGVPVWFTDRRPKNAPAFGEVISLEGLADRMQEEGMTDVTLTGDFPCLRIYHAKREHGDIFLLFNEDSARVADPVLSLPVKGAFVRADLLQERYFADTSADGRVPIRLLPGESLFLLFGEETEGLPTVPSVKARREVSPHISLELADMEELSSFRSVGELERLFSVTSRYPRFAGLMRYTLRFSAEEGENILDLGRVGQHAHLWVNGVDCGTRISAPYRFDTSAALQPGENTAVVLVGNTPAVRIRDRFSRLLALSPSGLLGPVTLEREE